MNFLKLNLISRLILLGGLILNPLHVLAGEKNIVDSQVFCKKRNEISIQEFSKLGIPSGYSDLDTHVLDKDFRHPKPKIPWSESKVFEDPVIGSYVGVVDRNYIPGASRIHTLWYRDVILAEGIQVFGYSAIRYEFNVLMIPNGDDFLVIYGCNGRFPVNERVAEVLRNQSSGKKMFIKLFAEDSGVGQLNEIGGGTVEAWKKIYANWTKSKELPAERLGY